MVYNVFDYIGVAATRLCEPREFMRYPRNIRLVRIEEGIEPNPGPVSDRERFRRQCESDIGFGQPVYRPPTGVRNLVNFFENGAIFGPAYFPSVLPPLAPNPPPCDAEASASIELRPPVVYHDLAVEPQVFSICDAASDPANSCPPSQAPSLASHPSRRTSSLHLDSITDHELYDDLLCDDLGSIERNARNPLDDVSDSTGSTGHSRKVHRGKKNKLKHTGKKKSGASSLSVFFAYITSCSDKALNYLRAVQGVHVIGVAETHHRQ